MSGRVVAGVVLAAIGAPVALVLIGPAGLIGLVLLVGSAAVLGKEALNNRTWSGSDPSGGMSAVGLRSPGPIDDTDTTATATELDVAESSDEQLCWAWRRSYAQLVATTDTAGLTRVAQQRRECLDELERRHPAGFAAWISSGARAGGDPGPYVRAHHQP